MITVTAGGDDVNERCLTYGMLPSATERTYTVDGLASYITKLEQLPQEAKDKMTSHAQDVHTAHVADSWKHPEALINTEFIGNYLLTPKDSTIRTNTKNYLYFVYKITANTLRQTTCIM